MKITPAIRTVYFEKTVRLHFLKKLGKREIYIYFNVEFVFVNNLESKS